MFTRLTRARQRTLVRKPLGIYAFFVGPDHGRRLFARSANPSLEMAIRPTETLRGNKPIPRSHAASISSPSRIMSCTVLASILRMISSPIPVAATAAGACIEAASYHGRITCSAVEHRGSAACGAGNGHGPTVVEGDCPLLCPLKKPVLGEIEIPEFLDVGRPPADVFFAALSRLNSSSLSDAPWT
jgi:hypothetical protein